MEQQADHSEPASHHDYMTSKNSRYKASETHYYQQQKENQSQLQQNEENQSQSSMEPTEYEDDEEEEEEEDEDNKIRFEEMRYSDARMGICSVCHYSIRSSDASPSDFEKALLCSDGHLLCHRCVQRFSIKSETNCVLCAATESQQSISSVSSNNEKKKKIKRRTPAQRAKREQQPQQQQRCYASTRASCTNVSSHCDVGLNYANDYYDKYSDSEREEVTYEEELEDQFQISVPLEGRQRSDSSLLQKELVNCTMKSQISSQMMSECSRRPIQCPRLDCAVNVAFSALTNHFIFDHPEVPVLSVDPGEKSTLIVNFDGLLYDSSRCLALLLVSGKLSGPAARQFNGSHIHPRFKNRLPLPILAARLYCNASCEGVHAAGEGNKEDGGDVVIAWVAGLDIGNTTTGALRCSIQAIDSIDSEAFRSLTYTGPINSLRTAQKPREVFLTGDCVILHDGFINHITSGCENLNVNVTIH